VPGDAAAIALGLANEMAGEKCDVRTGDGLDEVEDFIGEEPLEEGGICEVRNIHGFGALALGEGSEKIVEVLLQLLELGLGEDGIGVKKVALIVVGGELVDGKAGSKSGGHGLILL